MKKIKSLYLLIVISLVFVQLGIGQGTQKFLYTKGENNISIITMGTTSSAHCTVVEYPEFLVLHEIPKIPFVKNEFGSVMSENEKANLLITYIDSIYQSKPIKFILNSHHHSHSLSTVSSFLEKGTVLVSTKENVDTFEKKGLFGDKTSIGYSKSIIKISSDTTLLADTESPIEVIYLKKSDYKSIPTETYLFFNFTKHKLLATSCMVYLKDIDAKYGFKGMMHSDRLINVKEILEDKKIEVEKTLQLFKFRNEKGQRKLPIFPITYHNKVLKHSWHRKELSEHFQNMSYDVLTTKKDSLLSFLVESDIYHIVLNHAVYELIDKKEYQKAVAIAIIQVQYEPGTLNLIDSLGEAYYNNGQLAMAKHYNTILKSSKEKTDGLGLMEWEKNQKVRLVNGS